MVAKNGFACNLALQNVKKIFLCTDCTPDSNYMHVTYILRLPHTDNIMCSGTILRICCHFHLYTSLQALVQSRVFEHGVSLLKALIYNTLNSIT